MDICTGIKINSGTKDVIIPFLVYIGLVVLISQILLSLYIYSFSFGGLVFIVIFIILLIIVNIIYIIIFYSSLIEYNLTHKSYYHIYEKYSLLQIEERINKHLKLTQIPVEKKILQYQIYPDFVPRFLKNIDHIITTISPQMRIIFSKSYDSEKKEFPVLYIYPYTDVDSEIIKSIINAPYSN